MGVWLYKRSVKSITKIKAVYLLLVNFEKDQKGQEGISESLELRNQISLLISDA